VDPADVVSVPITEDEKMRCCAYRVVGVYDGPLPETYTTKYTPTDDSDQDGDGYDDDESGSTTESCPICDGDHDEEDCPENDSDDDTDYEAGYDRGYAVGKEDAVSGNEKAETTPTAEDNGWQAGWNAGYTDGFEENDTI